MKKIYLFIDGTNLYAGQYELFGPKAYLNFIKLIQTIEKNFNISFTKIFFYASYTPKIKKISKKLNLSLKNESLFYKNVKQTKNLIFFNGYRSKTSGKEKEVDVKLTADLVYESLTNKDIDVYLFSGDADFIQALIRVKSVNKNPVVISLQNRIMYKAVYFFKLIIISFDTLWKDKFKQLYGYKELRMLKKDVAVPIK